MCRYLLQVYPCKLNHNGGLVYFKPNNKYITTEPRFYSNSYGDRSMPSNQ